MDEGRLHILVFPWLAMGHLIPFLELSKCLARKGHKISFLSTPRNMKRLPKIPTTLSPLINLVELSLPQVDGLLADAEATVDLPVDEVHYLKKAFDGLKLPCATLLEDLLPDWVIYDFASYWLPPLASKLGIPCAFFSLFNASSVAFFGPSSALMGNSSDSWITMEDFSVQPKWLPPGSNLAFHLHEIARNIKDIKDDVSEVKEGYRYGAAVQGSRVLFIRSCLEFERDWLYFIEKEIHQKPVIPVGLLPPSVQESKGVDEDEKWLEMSAWLDKQRPSSVVYVALGTEATLSEEEMIELALGIELSNLPFFWVLRKPPGSVETYSIPLPPGFEERTKERGFICKGWAPQVRILAHPSVGGFLTHCGWNSIIESLGVGCALILLPIFGEQGLNARMLMGRNIGLEIPRDIKDGSFTKQSVTDSLRTVMLDEKGEIFRKQAMELKEIFGDRDLQDQYIDNFVRYLQTHLRCESDELHQ